MDTSAKITTKGHARRGQESKGDIPDKIGTDWLRNSSCTLIVVMLFLLIPLSAPAATYYVNAVSGNDSNAGTSESASWKTISKLNSRSFSPGDCVLFKRGCTWREQLTIRSAGAAGRPITFGAYGAGNLPDIDGADLVSSWTDNGSNTWRATTRTRPNQVMFNGTLGTHVSSAAACNSDDKWYWASNVLYAYGTQNPNITSDDKVEASQRETCIDVENRGL